MGQGQVFWNWRQAEQKALAARIVEGALGGLHGPELALADLSSRA